MSLNDFENVPDPDDAIVSKIGSAVRNAMAAKETLQFSIADAIDSSTNFGYELGVEDEKVRATKLAEAAIDRASKDGSLTAEFLFRAFIKELNAATE